MSGPNCNIRSLDVENGQGGPIVNTECFFEKSTRCCKTNCTASFMCWADNQLVGEKEVICKNGKWTGKKSSSLYETLPTCKYWICSYFSTVCSKFLNYRPSAK